MLFNVGAVLRGKEYHRLLTAGFLHVTPTHLIVNMLSLYFCGRGVELIYGQGAYLLIYLGSLLGGNLLALLMQRGNPGYSALGASGAISGVIFALVYLAPAQMFYLFFFLPIPAWLFAILFVGYSVFGMQTGHGNLGHEAHLGGAVIGMLLAIGLIPQALAVNWWVVLILLVPTVAATYLLYKDPFALHKLFGRKSRDGRFKVLRSDSTYGRIKTKNEKPSRREEMDALLDKVARVGYEGLSKEEQQRLDDLSSR